MRTLLFLLALLSPLLGWAQDDFVRGAYELTNGTKGTGLLHFESGAKAKLLVKDPKASPASKAQEFSAGKVRAFSILGDRYVALHSISLDSGKPGTATTLKNDFGKLLIDGKLELIEFAGPATPAGSAAKSAPDAPAKAYLLRRQGDDEAFSVPVMGKKYRELLTSFLEGRPDLIKKVPLKPLPDEDLRQLVKDYNSGSTEQ